MELQTTITVGNILTIVSFATVLFIHAIIITSKIAKSIAVSEMKFTANHERFIEQAIINKRIEENISKLDIKREEIQGEQIKLRSELPLELNHIKNDIEIIKENVTEILKMVTNIGIR